MKKVKYLIVIIIIFIAVFIGIELFRKVNNEETERNEINKEELIQQNNNIRENMQIQQTNAISIEELKDGQELLDKAEKILTARGWAGASNNIIGLKDGIIYYYDKGNGEFTKVATGIKDIYYKTEESEEIIVQKTDKTEIIGEIPQFIILE